MRFSACLCVLLVVLVSVSVSNGKKSFSSRRKSGSSNRRSGSSQHKAPAPAPATPHNSGSVSTNFLNSERAGSSHTSVNTHHRGSFSNKNPSAPEPPKHTVPQTNGPIGFERLNNQGNQNIGFGKVNSEVAHNPAGSHIPSAPSYPAGHSPYPGSATYPGKPPVGAPNGPPPAYPGVGSPGTYTGNYEPPPAYPGRPVNAPPVYSPNSPTYGQRTPGQPGVGGYPNQQGAYQQGSYPVQPGSYQQGAYPQPQSAYNGHNFQGQQNFGYQNPGSSFGNNPQYGYNQGFGSYGTGGFGSNSGGYGQSYPGFGGNNYGGSPFGHSNPYGASPFTSNYGSNSYGGSSFGNPHYSSNNFGFSSNPGFFGSSQNSMFGGGNNNYGYHKRSRFGGLPIPIPIPIPIPLGGFGGFGGRSHNHNVLDSFVKNKTLNTSDNVTTSVYILNNSTVTPCTTDQFIYDSLNVTVMSCTAGNCTAVKVFTTTNVSGEVVTNSAGITMCLEPNATYSTHADNVNPTVSNVHHYWMRVCKVNSTTNFTGNVTEQVATNSTVEMIETVINETITNDSNTTVVSQPSVLANSSETLGTTTESLVLDQNSTSSPLSNSTLQNSTEPSNSSFCEIFDCSWIEMCLPTIEIVDRCDKPECPFTRTDYRPCVRVRMCKSPSTPISTFATLNTTISRVDQLENITTVNDVVNLTLISYLPPALPVNCSEDASDPACHPPVILPQEVCAPSNSTGATGDGTSPAVNNATLCVPAVPLGDTNSTFTDLTTTEASSTAPTR